MFLRRALPFLLILCSVGLASSVAAEEPLSPQQTIAEFAPPEGTIGSTIPITGTGFTGSYAPGLRTLEPSL